MGQILDDPIITKDTIIGENDYAIFGCSNMQGYRISMEDRHCCLLDEDMKLSNTKENNEDEEKKVIVKPISFFGVFDGHSGQTAADYCSKHLLNKVVQCEETQYSSLNSVDAKHRIFNDNLVIENSFLKCDTDFSKNNEKSPDSSGTTCISVIIVPYNEKKNLDLICCNVGDSRCVLYDQGEIKALSIDHKPTLKEEMERIQKAGGYVEFGRVNGTLALSRAFGDITYKRNKTLSAREQCVIAVPGIQRKFLDNSKENKNDFSFLCLACDGIWDVMNNKSVCDFIKKRLLEQDDGTYEKNREKRKELLYQKKKVNEENNEKGENKNNTKKIEEKKENEEKEKNPPPKYQIGQICEDLIDHCVLELDSKDNVSAIIVLFKQL